MYSTNHLNGPIYHMVHFKNLANILKYRNLYSLEKLGQTRIAPHSIAHKHVQDLRDRVFVWSLSEKKYRSLHSYVPFYFATHTPMLRYQQKNNIQDDVLFFQVSRSILKEPGVLFTDGNAANQQLSRYKGEKVYIIPATGLNKPCKRKYYPQGPLGTNSKHSEFYNNIIFLDNLKWDVINDRQSRDDDKTRIRHAEVLIPDNLSLKLIHGISVKTPDMTKAVNTLIANNGLANRIPLALCQPDLYFQ